MANPLHRLRFLPWKFLVQDALLTTLLVAAIEIVLIWGAIHLPVINQTIGLFLSVFGLIATALVGLGAGALAVYLLERVFPQVIINSGVLWALVLCLGVSLYLRGLIPLLPVAFPLDQPEFLGLVLGIFWKGRPYWKRF